MKSNDLAETVGKLVRISRGTPLDEVLEVLEGASMWVATGGDPRTVASLALDFIRIRDSRESLPRRWRSNRGDVDRASLCAYHVLSAMERSDHPSIGTACVWAKMGRTLADDLGWAASRSEFHMLELLAIAATRNRTRLRMALQARPSLAELPSLHPLRIEYLARLVDLHHLNGAWEAELAVLTREIIPLSYDVEALSFQAARHLSAARAAVRIDGAVSRAEEHIQRANDLLIADQEIKGHEHEFFRFWWLCAIGELRTVMDDQAGADVALATARAQRLSAAYDAHFLADALTLFCSRFKV